MTESDEWLIVDGESVFPRSEGGVVQAHFYDKACYLQISSRPDADLSHLPKMTLGLNDDGFVDLGPSNASFKSRMFYHRLRDLTDSSTDAQLCSVMKAEFGLPSDSSTKRCILCPYDYASRNDVSRGMRFLCQFISHIRCKHPDVPYENRKDDVTMTWYHTWDQQRQQFPTHNLMVFPATKCKALMHLGPRKTFVVEQRLVESAVYHCVSKRRFTIALDHGDVLVFHFERPGHHPCIFIHIENQGEDTREDSLLLEWSY